MVELPVSQRSSPVAGRLAEAVRVALDSERSNPAAASRREMPEAVKELHVPAPLYQFSGWPGTLRRHVGVMRPAGFEPATRGFEGHCSIP